MKADRRLRGSYLDEGLEAEGEDCHEPYDVPAGALGRLLTVRQARRAGRNVIITRLHDCK
ncbi:hypothetical protein ACFYNW_38500 [Streptomyces virginiae]|uniref:hypothetical protein n=1 Tax=Streptomyces virginiae TaxID=1961 RepID=UPI0036E6DCAC